MTVCKECGAIFSEDINICEQCGSDIAPIDHLNHLAVSLNKNSPYKKSGIQVKKVRGG